jgi:hypothetical protein
VLRSHDEQLLFKLIGHELFPAGEPVGVELGLMLLDNLKRTGSVERVAKATSRHCILVAWLMLPTLAVVLLRTHSRVMGTSPQPHFSSQGELALHFGQQ